MKQSAGSLTLTITRLCIGILCLTEHTIAVWSRKCSHAAGLLSKQYRIHHRTTSCDPVEATDERFYLRLNGVIGRFVPCYLCHVMCAMYWRFKTGSGPGPIFALAPDDTSTLHSRQRSRPDAARPVHYRDHDCCAGSSRR